ncbi:MAG: DUF4158 domain-containing protein [Mycobacteriales bacterium]
MLPDPTDVPTEIVDYLAEQLGIDDLSCVKAYRVREMTRLEHAREIRDSYGFSEFTNAEQELARWVDDRAWTTGDEPKPSTQVSRVTWCGAMWVHPMRRLT